MNKNKSRSVTLGAFIVGAVLLIFIVLLFFSGGQLFSPKERIIMYFNSSVQGLQVGAPIKLKGVVLGEITDIQINFQSDDKTVLNAVTADLAIKRISRKGANVNKEFFAEAIHNGLRAQLNYQSLLTGLLYVELDFFPDSQLHLYGFQSKYLELPTIATGLEEFTKNIQKINIEGLVENLEKITEQAAQIVGSGKIEQTMDSLNSAATSIEKTSTNLNSEIAQLSKDVRSTNAELNKLLKTLNKEAPVISESLNDSLKELQASLVQVNKAANTISNTFSEDTPLVHQISVTLEDISRSARSIQSLSETLEQQPEALLRGKKTYGTEE